VDSNRRGFDPPFFDCTSCLLWFLRQIQCRSTDQLFNEVDVRVHDSRIGNPFRFASLFRFVETARETLGPVTLCLGLLASVLPHVAAAQTATPVNVPIWRYDNANSGMNTQETLLTPANVNSNTFGKLFSYAVDGYVYAQPLYISGLSMPDGKVHNVLFVATEHDSVYAFDADSDGGSNAFPLWQASLISTTYGAAAGATTVPSWELSQGDIVPEVGITSTPVIDIAAHTMFVVAKSLENGVYVQRLHALNIITGAEQSYGPSQPITATVPGTGNASSGGLLTFSPEWQNQRVSLALFNGYVFVAWGSHGDNGPWHGWIMAFNESTLAQTGVICTSPNGYGNGIWESGAGMPIDTVTPNGRMFAVAGNGDYTSYPPLTSSVDYGESIIRFDLTGGAVTPTDAFTPFNQATLSASDVDQGSGGILMLPDQTGTYPHELIQVGKEGRILVLNRDDLGGYAPGGTDNPNVLQDIDGQLAGGMWATPTYWNGHVYFWGLGDYLKRFDLVDGVLSTTPSSIGGQTSGFPAPSVVVSSNGTSNGVLWAIRSDGYDSNGSGILYAYDPTNLSTVLYESDTNSRDDGGPANKFVVPVVTNGKVYTGAAYQVNIYGLLNGQQQAAAPTITPNGGTFGVPQQVTLASTTPNATIYYTTDGSLPTAASNVYSTPITISLDTTIRAISSAQNYLQSQVTTAVFNFVNQTPAPTFSPVAGSYTSSQSVTISDSVAGATIYYTTDGSTPTTNSAVYSAPISVTFNETINAMAISGTLTPSSMTSSTYVIQIGGSGIDFGSGFANVDGLTLNGSAINTDDSRLQLTNGGYNEAGSAFGNTPLNITSWVNDFLFELSDATEYGFTFTIQNVGPTALGPDTSGLGYGATMPIAGYPLGIPNSVAVKFDFYNTDGEGTDSTGIYENGASPTIPAVDMTSSGVILNSGHILQAHMTYNGSTLFMSVYDAVNNATFTHSFPINIPQVIGSNTAYVGFTAGTGFYSASQKILTWTFISEAGTVTAPPVISPGGGTFSSAQQVSISDNSDGAVIYYTIDGSTPTTNSPVYSAPFTVDTGTTTVNAKAVGLDGNQSSTTSAIFSVGPFTAEPAFKPAPGNYTSAMSVSLGDATPNATIFYTIDGSQPSHSSAVYGSPIQVSGLSLTIKAFASASGYADSPVVMGTYSIGQTTPVITWPSPAPISCCTPLTATQLNATANVPGTFTYNWPLGTVLPAGSWKLTATFTPTDTVDYTTATASVTLIINKGNPVIVWNPPAAITYGTALSSKQLDAESSYNGTFTYTPPAGTVLTAGSYTLSTTLTPTAANDYNTATATVPMTVNPATPAITWPTPASMPYGTALTAAQLNASSPVAGTFSYSPPMGTVLTAGSQTLSVTFTPADTADYTTASSSVQLTVGKATPAITWAAPAAITYGTALSATQLNAVSSVAGTFAYSPALGTVLTAGSKTLSLTFTPTNTTDYTTVTSTVPLTVTKATPQITWATPAPIRCCTALSTAQLNATANVPGTFTYNWPTGSVLPAASWKLTVTFTPTDNVDYCTATASVTLIINKGTPTIVWNPPAAITYGTALSSKQLDAESSYKGTFTYTPPAGTMLTAGSYTLSTTLTPTAANDYNTATATVPLTVNPATPAITWQAPAPISYGTALSATQLNASSIVPGTFTYSPAPGAMLTAGSKTLSVTFTPTDSTDYTTVTATVQLTVNQTMPAIAWTTPAAISYGTALSANQLDATSAVPGVFTYSPALGTVLTAGSQTLSVNFTPTDTTDYTSATATVQLTVNKVTPAITWVTPAPIYCCTALDAAQLDASTTVPGTFTYNWPAGSVLPAATWKLTATFTPTDTVDYNTTAASVSLIINKGNPVIVWNAPAAITYGTALSYKQLDAESSYSGTFAYTPPAGTVLAAGAQTLSTTLTPTAANDYNSASATVPLTVNPAVLTVAANNLSIAYGAALPTFTYTLSGFVNGDTAATATTGTPSLSTNATSTSLPGTYAITPIAGTLAATNYSFQFTNGTLTITPLGTVATPTFSVAAGTYSSTQSVQITDATAGATIYYTTNGSTPTATSGTKYTGAISVSTSETINAVAVETGYTSSTMASAAYTIN
jgi:hypothetical protein